MPIYISGDFIKCIRCQSKWRRNSLSVCDNCLEYTVLYKALLEKNHETYEKECYDTWKKKNEQ